MKKLIVIGIVATMVMGLAGAASAALDTVWAMQLRVTSPVIGGLTAGVVTLGTRVGALDTYTTALSEDGVLLPATGTPAELISTLVPAQRTNKDQRAPLLAGQTKTWNLSLYIVGGAPGGIKLDGWMVPTAMLDLSTGVDPNIVVTLKQGDTILWTVPYSVSGTSALPTFTHNFAYDGTPIALQLVATAPVPEPGSMVALFSGLIGLVGFGIRRRK